MARPPFGWAKELLTHFLRTRNGSSCKLRDPPSNSGCCPLEPAKPSRSLTIRSTISGPAGFPDGKRFIFSGNEPGKGVRLYTQELAGGTPKAISPEGVDATAFAVSPDGQSVVGTGPDGKGYFYPTAGGDPRVVNGLEPGDIPIIWNSDGRSIYLYRTGEVPAKVYQLDLATGKKTVRQQIVPVDTTGVSTIGPIQTTPDGKTYVYGFHRTLGDLYLVEGLK